MSYVITVTFGETLNPNRTEFPPEINMEFSSAFDAVDYFYCCLRYFEAAKKWDPEYYGLSIICHFWEGNKLVKNIQY